MQVCDAGGGVVVLSWYNVEAHSLSPFIRKCIVRVVRVEGWSIVAASGKERGGRGGRKEPEGESGRVRA